MHDLRRWARDVHHTVDDVPFGGGPGMVMKPDVWGDALDEIVPADGGAARLVVPTPSGVPFSQDMAARYAAEPRLVFACGRYEGIDGRVVEAMRDRMPVDEVSIGDYVLAGGEAAALVMIEAVGRLLPGVLGNASSAGDDSFGGDGDPGGRHARAARGPGLHPAAGLAGARGARGAAVGQPRRDRALAPRHGAAPDRRAPARSHRGPCATWIGATGRCWPRLAFRLVAKIWHTEVRCLFQAPGPGPREVPLARAAPPGARNDHHRGNRCHAYRDCRNRAGPDPV